MKKLLFDTSPSKSLVLIRLMVGMVFLSEGIQKFLFPDIRGAGRFEKIGLPEPEFLGFFVGSFEVVCGLFIILGFLTRLASIPLLIIMMVAITSTKSTVFLQEGFWAMLHGSRTDWAMTLGSVFLLINGSGLWSLDWYFRKKIQDGSSSN